VTVLFLDKDYPADPYPGARPDCSFVHFEGAGHPLSTAPEGWRTGRVPVLAYGSNACPSKITWLRDTLGLTGPVPVVRAECTGLVACWAAGVRARDGQRPATLAAAPGHTEWHAIWFADPDQLRVLDVCEGRGDRYELARVHTGTVTLDDGGVLPEVFAYVGARPERMPLLVNGKPVLTVDVPQYEARNLDGVPASSHDLSVTIL
jgi:hypothetical protein